MIRLAILASGRGSNAEALIRACQSGKVRAEAALVLADREAGVLTVAERLGVASQRIEAAAYADRAAHERALAGALHHQRIDVLALAGYRRLLSPFLIGFLYDPRLSQSRILNIHPADTQAYQGLNGYAWALQQRLEQTAVTVHYVDEGMDTGRILAQEKLPIHPGESLQQLEQRGLALEHRLYPEALQMLVEELEGLCAVF